MGRTFVIEGRKIDLFPIGTLCNVLGRNYRAIYRWERDFGFPPALFVVADDKKRKRWYSRGQLIAIRHIYESLGCLRKKHRSQLGAFIAAVRRVFYEVDQPIAEREKRDDG